MNRRNKKNTPANLMTEHVNLTVQNNPYIKPLWGPQKPPYLGTPTGEPTRQKRRAMLSNIPAEAAFLNAARAGIPTVPGVSAPTAPTAHGAPATTVARAPSPLPTPPGTTIQGDSVVGRASVAPGYVMGRADVDGVKATLSEPVPYSQVVGATRMARHGVSPGTTPSTFYPNAASAAPAPTALPDLSPAEDPAAAPATGMRMVSRNLDSGREIPATGELRAGDFRVDTSQMLSREDRAAATNTKPAFAGLDSKHILGNVNQYSNAIGETAAEKKAGGSLALREGMKTRQRLGGFGKPKEVAAEKARRDAESAMGGQVQLAKLGAARDIEVAKQNALGKNKPTVLGKPLLDAEGNVVTDNKGAVQSEDVLVDPNTGDYIQPDMTPADMDAEITSLKSQIGKGKPGLSRLMPGDQLGEWQAEQDQIPLRVRQLRGQQIQSIAPDIAPDQVQKVLAMVEQAEAAGETVTEQDLRALLAGRSQ